MTHSEEGDYRENLANYIDGYIVGDGIYLQVLDENGQGKATIIVPNGTSEMRCDISLAFRQTFPMQSPPAFNPVIMTESKVDDFGPGIPLSPAKFKSEKKASTTEGSSKGPSPLGSDWYVCEPDPVTKKNEPILLEGNLIICPTGILIFEENVELIMWSRWAGQYGIFIEADGEDRGKFEVRGNSLIRSYLDTDTYKFHVYGELHMNSSTAMYIYGEEEFGGIVFYPDSIGLIENGSVVRKTDSHAIYAERPRELTIRDSTIEYAGYRHTVGTGHGIFLNISYARIENSIVWKNLEDGIHIIKTGLEPSSYGKPSYTPGQDFGYFAWWDEGGWNVKYSTINGECHYYTGTVRYEPDGYIYFERTLCEGEDGPENFGPDSYWATFDLWIDGVRAFVQDIYYGAGSWNPESNPFTLTKMRQPQIIGSTITRNFRNINMRYSSPLIMNCPEISFSEVGIDVEEESSPTILNNVIFNNTYGIYVKGSRARIAQGNHIHTNAMGIWGYDFSTLYIEGNNVSYSVGGAQNATQPYIEGVGILAGNYAQPAEGYIRDNELWNNEHSGIFLLDVSQSQLAVVNNTVRKSSFGIYLAYGENYYVERNNVSQNYIGIYCYGIHNAPVPISLNNVSLNIRGMDLRMSHAAIVVGNNVSDNQDVGIAIRSRYHQSYQDQPVIDTNDITNSSRGIWVFPYTSDIGGEFVGASPYILNNEIWNTDFGIYSNLSAPRIEGNTIHSNNYSIYVNSFLQDKKELDTFYANASILGNTIYSDLIGVWVTNCSPIIEANEIFENEDYGIYSDMASPSIVKNTIYSNPEGIYVYGAYPGILDQLTDGSKEKIIEFPIGGGEDSSVSITLPKDSSVFSARLDITGLPIAVSEDVGSGRGTSNAHFWDIAVGDGDNDNLDEIFAVETDYDSGFGTAYVFDWDGSGWSKRIMGSSHLPYLKSVAVGDADNDLKNEVYAGSEDGELYKFVYWEEYDTWSYQHIADTGDPPNYDTIREILVADSDNDGYNELNLVSDYMIHIYKYSGGSYNKAWEIPLGVFFEHDMDVGDGDNGGSNKIYVNHWQNIKQYEYDSSQGRWQMSVVAYNASYFASVAVGDGDDDGQNEVYGAYLGNYGMFEYTREDGGWSEIFIDYTHSGSRVLDIQVGDGDNDAKNEVYACDVSRYLYEFNWNGEEWDKSTFYDPTIMGSMMGIGIGDGDIDGNNEIYISSLDDHVYQFTEIHPTNPTLDVGDDGSVEWSFEGELKIKTAVDDSNTIPPLAVAIQNYLNENPADPQGNVEIPLSFVSESGGKLKISEIQVTLGPKPSIESNTIVSGGNYAIRVEHSSPIIFGTDMNPQTITYAIGIYLYQSSASIDRNHISSIVRDIEVHHYSYPDITNNVIDTANYRGVEVLDSSSVFASYNQINLPTPYYFTQGVHVGSGCSADINNNTITAYYGIRSAYSNLVVRDNLISNSVIGIDNGHSTLLIWFNEVHYNNLGIEDFASVPGSRITRNWVNWSLGRGIQLDSSSSRVDNNTVYSNYAGIYVTAHSTSEVRNNTVESNSHEGIWAYHVPAVISGNIVTYNENGISTYYDPNTIYEHSPTISWNTIEHNSKNGILVQNDLPTIHNNTVEYNDRNGIYLDHGSPYIRNNTLTYNSRAGINSSYATPAILGNWVNDNDGWGMHLRFAKPSNAEKEALRDCNWLGPNGKGQILQEWNIRMRVIDENGDGQVGAVVEVYEKVGEHEWFFYEDYLTGEGGYTEWVPLRQYFVENDGTYKDRELHLFSVEFEGKTGSSQEYVDDNKLVEIEIH